MLAVGRAAAPAHRCLADQSQFVQEATHPLAVRALDWFRFAAQLGRHPPIARGRPRRRDLLDGCEAGLPHHYFTPEELGVLFPALVVADLHLDTDQHYCLTAIKQA